MNDWPEWFIAASKPTYTTVVATDTIYIETYPRAPDQNPIAPVKTDYKRAKLLDYCKKRNLDPYFVRELDI